MRHEDFVPVNQGYKKRQLTEEDKQHGLNYLCVEILYQFPLYPNIEHDPAIIMQKMELLWKELNKRFIDKEKQQDILKHAEQYAILAGRLVTAAEQFELVKQREKEKHQNKIQENLATYGKHDPELPD